MDYIKPYIKNERLRRFEQFSDFQCSLLAFQCYALKSTAKKYHLTKNELLTLSVVYAYASTTEMIAYAQGLKSFFPDWSPSYLHRMLRELTEREFLKRVFPGCKKKKYYTLTWKGRMALREYNKINCLSLSVK